MDILEVLHYPDERLRTIARPVTKFDNFLLNFIAALSATMYERNGIGLAATQVNRHIRVIAVDVSDERNDLKIFVNPEVSQVSVEKVVKEEGCLSVPGQFVKVFRPKNIVVTAFNEYGQPFELTATGLLSACIQHEIDHLDGKLILDHLSFLKQQVYREKCKKIKKQIEKRQHNSI